MDFSLLLTYLLGFGLLLSVLMGLGLIYEFAWWALSSIAERRWKRDSENKNRNRR